MTSTFVTLISALGAVALLGCAATTATSPPLADATPKLVCHGGPVHSDIDLISYSGCRRIDGDLTLAGISNFAPLFRLEQVDGQLKLIGNSAHTLTGLEHLRAVDTLVIDSNQQLDDIDALSNLSVVTRVIFNGNPNLASPKGLDGVLSLNELVVRQSGFLSLAGLEHVHRVGRLVISDNHRLISIGGLRHVTRIDELVLERNSRICASPGLFRGLEQPPIYSSIRHNPTLFDYEIAKLTPLSNSREIAKRN
jgi:hypothetical protein